jgi:hypothetical protein
MMVAYRHAIVGPHHLTRSAIEMTTAADSTATNGVQAEATKISLLERMAVVCAHQFPRDPQLTSIDACSTNVCSPGRISQ